MKQQLISKWLHLKTLGSHGALCDSLDMSIIAIEMMRIEIILHLRYQYDISMNTPKIN